MQLKTRQCDWMRTGKNTEQFYDWRLAGGDVVFEKVGVLQPGKLDGEAVFEVADDAALHLAERYQGADRGALFGGDTGARLRNVDDSAGEVDAVRHDQAARRFLRRDAAVAAVFRRIEQVAIGEPGELGSKLVALSLGGCDRHRKTALELARDVAFEAAQVIDIGDDALAGLGARRRHHRHTARRHINDLAWEFAPVRQHVAAEQIDIDPLEAATVLTQRP